MHISPKFPRLGWRVLTLAAALAGAAAAAPAQTGKPRPVPPPVVPSTPAQPPAALNAPAAPEPPDGKWLVDKEGRKYFVVSTPRIEGYYTWLDKEHTKVRLPYGMGVDLASYDDKTFWVKVYKQEEVPPAPAPQRRSPEELAKRSATYKFDLPTVHRLDFSPFDDGLPKRGQWRNGFVVADMDGDGHLDIVHGPARKGGNRPVVFLGDGKGHWKQWAATFPQIPFDYGDIAVGDLNGDGKLDMVVASHLRGMTALLGDGKGNFTSWSQGIEFELPGNGQTKPPFSSRAIQIVDWNHDGRPDILAAGEGPRLALTRGSGSSDAFNRGARGSRIYLNQGNGTWLPQDEQNPVVFGDAVASGDFNGDGHLDFASGSSILGYKEILAYGQPDGSWKRVAVDLVRPDAVVTALVVADFDHDGRDDLAVAYTSSELGVWRTGIDILYSRPGESWERRTLFNEESRTGISSLAAGDLDGDGARDLVALIDGGGSWIFLGDRKGWFSRESGSPVPAGESGCRGYHAVLADVDGDGRDELLIDFAGEGISPTSASQCANGGGLHVWKAARQTKK